MANCFLPIARLFGLAGVLAACAASAPAAESWRLDRQNLLEYRNPAGAVVPVRSIHDWKQRRAEIVAGAEAVMGPLPGNEKRVPLAIRVDEEVDCGSYVRRLISYMAEPGSRVPAYLLIPKAVLAGDAVRPGVLCLMPTNNEAGNRSVVGLGGANARPNRNYGQELAERGYVIIAPPYPWLAGYEPDLKKLGYQSGTMKAIWDNIRALDVLGATPGVKLAGFGAIGHSLGGHNAIYTAVFDERIAVIVSSCGFDSYLDYLPKLWQQGRGWAQERYMPRILRYARAEIPFDFHELIGALAPRPIFVNAPTGDSNFGWQSVDRVVAAAAQVYRLYGVPALLQVEHPDCGHDFPSEIREAAYTWIDRALW